MKNFIVLTDRPIRPDQSFQTEGGLWAVCCLPAFSESHALKLTKGYQWWGGGIVRAIEGDFIWKYGRVVGLNLKKKV